MLRSEMTICFREDRLFCKKCLRWELDSTWWKSSTSYRVHPTIMTKQSPLILQACVGPGEFWTIDWSTHLQRSHELLRFATWDRVLVRKILDLVRQVYEPHLYFRVSWVFYKAKSWVCTLGNHIWIRKFVLSFMPVIRKAKITLSLSSLASRERSRSPLK